MLLGPLASCGASDVFIAQPWPDDHTAVVIVTDADGRPTGPLRIVLPGESVTRWSLSGQSDTRLYARSWSPENRAPDGSALSACGLTLGGNGPAAPEATAGWRTDVVTLAADGAVAFREEQAPLTAFDLRLTRCEVQIDRQCPGHAARSLTVPEGFQPRKLVHLGTHALIFSPPIEPGGPNRLARASPDGVFVLPPDEKLGTGVVRGMGWDPNPAPGRVLLFHDTGLVMTVTRDGGYTGQFQVSRAFKVSTGLDGESMFAGPDGLFVVPTGQTTEVAISGTLPEAIPPDDIDEVFAHRPALRMLRYVNDVYEWQDGEWRLAFLPALLDVVSQIGADRSYRGLVGEFELVRVRNPLSGEWQKLSPPFDQGHRFRGIDGLLDTRFMVVGDGASVAVWAGTQWCQVRHTGPLSTLTHVETSSRGRDGYAIGSDEDSEAQIILYIDVPDA